MRLKLLTIAAACLAGVALPTPVGAASGGGCQLNGTAAFNPGLTNTAANFTYSFSGALSSCQNTDAAAPATGSVEAGKTVSVPYSWSYVDSLGASHSGSGTATYQEPLPTGNGSCGTSTTAGTAIITWADGTKTVESYSTTGAAAAVNLSGSVVASVTATLASFTGPSSAPAGSTNLVNIPPASTFTISTSRYAGDSTAGVLTFQPPDPTLCSSTGVTTAAISGEAGLGTAP